MNMDNALKFYQRIVNFLFYFGTKRIVKFIIQNTTISLSYALNKNPHQFRKNKGMDPKR